MFDHVLLPGVWHTSILEFLNGSQTWLDIDSLITMYVNISRNSIFQQIRNRSGQCFVRWVALSSAVRVHSKEQEVTISTQLIWNSFSNLPMKSEEGKAEKSEHPFGGQRLILHIGISYEVRSRREISYCGRRSES